VRLPDVAFVARARQPVLEGVEFPFAPDLAVEVVSPGDSAAEVLDKVALYLQAGTRLVWTVYPDEETVYVWQAAEGGGFHVRKFDRESTLDGGDVLPGFTLAVRDLFAR
jgi:Uma2 family endonuclease